MHKQVRIPINSIKVGERFRKDLGDLESLKQSIAETGLIHPPAVDGNLNLVAGGRRYAACKALGWTDIPVTLAETDGTETHLRIMEYEENDARLAMNWKEKVKLVAYIHLLNQRDAHLKGEKWAVKTSADLLHSSVGKVHYCLQLAEMLTHPEHPIHAAESVTDALRIIAEMKAEESKRLIVAKSVLPNPVLGPADITAIGDIDNIVSDAIGGKLTEPISTPAPTPMLPAVPTEPYKRDVCGACEGSGRNTRGDVCPICKGGAAQSFDGDTVTVPISTMVYNANCLELIPRLRFDHIVCDPPYAIDMANLQQNSGLMDVSKTAKEHKVDENLVDLAAFVKLAAEHLPDKGWLVMFCDAMHFRWLHDLGVAAGLKVQRWPLIWAKPHAKNESASFNWTKCTEEAIVMRKGVATLVQLQATNFYLVPPEDKSMFAHPFAKPVDLLVRILSAIALPGQIVLDPFCGSGTTLYAAAKIGLRPLGVEKVQTHYNETVVNLQKGYNAWFTNRKVVFK